MHSTFFCAIYLLCWNFTLVVLGEIPTHGYFSSSMHPYNTRTFYLFIPLNWITCYFFTCLIYKVCSNFLLLSSTFLNSSFLMWFNLHTHPFYSTYFLIWGRPFMYFKNIHKHSSSSVAFRLFMYHVRIVIHVTSHQLMIV